MKIKTSELTGAALDWAVNECEGGIDRNVLTTDGQRRLRTHNYSTNWAKGGPIIDQVDGFELKCWLESKPESRCEAHIHNYDGDWIAFGPTPLIAAMRCYVASKLGDTVEIPGELV